MRAIPLLLTVLGCAACASSPTTERPVVDRPEVQRPEGVEPEGLADVRDTLGEQRATTREQENALLMSPNTLSPESETSIFETMLSPFAEVLHFLRNF